MESLANCFLSNKGALKSQIFTDPSSLCFRQRFCVFPGDSDAFFKVPSESVKNRKSASLRDSQELKLEFLIRVLKTESGDLPSRNKAFNGDLSPKYCC